MRVCKKSGKKFKSGRYINTVSGICNNPEDPKYRTAYTFEEDDSIVNCDMCIEVPDIVAEAVLKENQL